MDTTDEQFKTDLAEIAVEKYKSGRLSRRGFLTALGAMGLGPMLGKGTQAQASEIVICNWGGAASDILADVMGTAFTAETGIPLRVDGAGPSPGKVRAMVESGAVVWDVLDSGAGSAIVMNEAGVIQPIDYDVVDASKVLEGTALPFAVGNYLFGYGLATNPTMLPNGSPTTWADVWDVEQFPGIRTFRKSVRGQLESAVLAMGIPKEEVYDFLDEQMEPGTFELSFEGGVLQPGMWAVPTNNPSGTKAAMNFIAMTQDPDLQVEWFNAIGNAPINPEAAAKVSSELAPWNPADAANVAKMVIYSDEWYGKNQVHAEELYIDALIG